MRRRTLILFGAAVVIVLGLLLLFEWGRRNSAERQVAAEAGDPERIGETLGLFTNPASSGAAGNPMTPPAASPSADGSSDERGINRFLPLLSEGRLIPRMLPSLDPTTEQDLIDYYNHSASDLEKRNIWRILSCQGESPSAFGVLTNALIHEFAGKRVSRSMVASLEALPFWLGLSSLRSEAMLQFLMAGKEIEFWEGTTFWRKDPPRYHEGFSAAQVMAKTCLKGLLAFGQGLEVESLIESYRDRGSVVDMSHRRISPAVMDGMFWRYQVDVMGAEEAMNQLYQIDLTQKLRVYREWKYDSADGREWDALRKQSPGTQQELDATSTNTP